MNIEIANIYKDVFNENVKEVVLRSGRNAGKSKFMAQYVFLDMFQNTELHDGIVAKSTGESIETTVFNEIQSVFVEYLGSDAYKKFRFIKNPCRITRNDGSTIYFSAIGGDSDRTKGIKTLHKCSFVMLDELQQLRTLNEYKNAMASFRRNLLNDDFKILNLFNPPQIKTHWINLWFEEKKKDKSVLTITPTYLDILKYLNDFDIKEILKEKLLHYDYYKWLYLGEPCNLIGLVYPMFERRYLISETEMHDILKRIAPKYLIFGCDAAVNNDETVICPMLVLENAQTICLPLFIHNPKETKIIGSHILVKEYITKYVNWIFEKYNIVNANYGRQLPTFFRYDSAAADFGQEIKFFFSQNCDTAPIRKKSILEMVSVVQSVFSNQQFYILDNGITHDYYLNKDKQYEIHPLVEQIENLTWNDKEDGYDGTIPNDRTDAMTYGMLFFYGNIENKGYFEIMQTMNRNCVKIKDVIGR